MYTVHDTQNTQLPPQGIVALLYTQVSSGVALPGSVEASVGLVAVGLGIIQQLM